MYYLSSNIQRKGDDKLKNKKTMEINDNIEKISNISNNPFSEPENLTNDISSSHSIQINCNINNINQISQSKSEDYQHWITFDDINENEVKDINVNTLDLFDEGNVINPFETDSIAFSSNP